MSQQFIPHQDKQIHPRLGFSRPKICTIWSKNQMYLKSRLSVQFLNVRIGKPKKFSNDCLALSILYIINNGVKLKWSNLHKLLTKLINSK